MTNNLTEPSPGDPISATLMRELIRTVRANRLIQGKNVLLGRGPNGTVVNVAVPAPSPSKKPKDVGRFAIVSKTDPDAPDEPPTKVMTNCYYDVGGKTYDMEDQDLPEVEEDAELFVALKVAATGYVVSAEIETYETFAALQSAQADRDYYVIPLYKLAASGAVLVDFRVGPSASMGEF